MPTMPKTEFVRILEGQLGLPQGGLKEDQRLAEVEGWDSMAAVLFVALADEQLGVTIPGAAIAKSKTVRELLSLVGERLS
jgi:acyl carrier protein